jgi:hypothetical protein
MEFELDINHLFEINRPEHVCKNTADMLSKTRYKNYFEIIGDTKIHFGAFSGCATLATLEAQNNNTTGDISTCGC